LATYFSPAGNPEVWLEKPAGYFTPEEWAAAHPEPEPPAPTPEEIQARLVAAVQGYLDKKAKERGYDGILSACSYASSTDAVFAAEGQACLAWRDEVWRKCYEVLDAVTAGERDVPTAEELLAELPALTWPEPS
jgi:hypothetical protein